MSGLDEHIGQKLGDVVPVTHGWVSAVEGQLTSNGNLLVEIGSRLDALEKRAGYNIDRQITEDAYTNMRMWKERAERAERDLSSARAEADSWRQNRDDAVAIVERDLELARSANQAHGDTIANLTRERDEALLARSDTTSICTCGTGSSPTWIGAHASFCPVFEDTMTNDPYDNPNSGSRFPNDPGNGPREDAP